MKRWIALLLAMVMALSLVVPAWAEEGNVTLETNEASTGNLPVTVTITGATTVYNVTVKWEDLSFTYKQGEWKPSEHKYSGGVLNKQSAKVTVTNHSNAPIKYAAFLDSTETNGVTMTLEGNHTATLARPAVESSYESAPSDFFTVKVAIDFDNHDLATTVKHLAVQIYAVQP